MGVSPAYLSTILALTICCVSTMCEAGLQDVNMWKQDELQTMGFLVQANHRKETVRAILLLTAFTSTLAGLVRVAHAAWTTADEWNITDGKVVWDKVADLFSSHRARSTDRVSRHRSTNNQTYSAWEIHLERAKSCEAKIRGSHKVNVLAGWPGRHDKQLDCSLCLLKTMKGWLLYIQSCARHLIWCAILICVVLPIYRGLFHDTVGDVLWTSSTFWNISLLEENMKAQQALCTILKTVGASFFSEGEAREILAASWE